MERYTFTVFTPTYNRAYTLPRVYASLKAQTFQNFEWLIVDDGSTDGTRALVQHWQDGQLRIDYIWQENSGKHIALNRAVQRARGELFLVLDSDDACVPEALERFLAHWMAIEPTERQRFVGVTSLCKDLQGRLVGTRFPTDIWDANSLEYYYRSRVIGEKWGFQRVDILRQFPFPAIPHTYIGESLVWKRIAKCYQTRFVNEELRIYDVPPNGYRAWRSSASGRAVGAQILYQSNLNEHLRWTKYKPWSFVLSAIGYCRYGFYLRQSLKEQWRGLQGWAKILWVLCVLAGWGIYWVHDRHDRAHPECTEP
jgi:glycosyltransferase involved in cell wall biosynthesis